MAPPKQKGKDMNTERSQYYVFEDTLTIDDSTTVYTYGIVMWRGTPPNTEVVAGPFDSYQEADEVAGILDEEANTDTEAARNVSWL
jgi:hypothetical protein